MKCAAEFAHIQFTEYRNINELMRVHDRLHVCETLFGDVAAEVMVIGQDPANYEKIAAWNSYCHDPRAPTNILLKRCLSPFLSKTPDDPRHCGVFFANAIWLLKNGGDMSAPLYRPAAAFRACLPVLNATFVGLPRLKLVIALGQLAYLRLRNIDKSLSRNWSSIALSGSLQNASLFGRSFYVATTYHLGRRGQRNRIAAVGENGSAASLLEQDFNQIYNHYQLHNLR